MPPRRELNDRFKAHIAKAQRVRRVVTTSLLVTCLLVGSGLAFEMIVPPHSIARATLNNNLAAVRDALPDPIAPLASMAANARDAFVSLGTSAATSISDMLASLNNVPAVAHDQLAAASSLPWLDNFGNVVYRVFCPLFRDCPANDAVAQLPSNANPQHATSFQNVKRASQLPPPRRPQEARLRLRSQSHKTLPHPIKQRAMSPLLQQVHKQ